MKQSKLSRAVLIHVLLLLQGLFLYAQEFRQYIRMYPVPEVSEMTNAYLRRIGDFVFISSIDGLNVLHGQNMRVLRSGRDGLYDANVQSDFFHDGGDRVWFCTFTGFYYFDLVTGQVMPFRVTDHNGDTLRSEYRVIALAGNHLFIQNGEEILGFDTERHVVSQRWCPGPCVLCGFAIEETSDGFRIVAGNIRGAEAMFGNFHDEIEDRVHLISGAVTATAQAGGSVWISGPDSILYQVVHGSIVGQSKLHDVPVSLSGYADDLLINYGNHFTRMHTRTRAESPEIRLYHDRTPLSDIRDLQIDHDSILWISADGAGVFSTKLNMHFRDFVREPYSLDPPITTAIAGQQDGGQIVLFSTNRGMLTLRPDGTPVSEKLTDQHQHIIDAECVIRYQDAFLYYCGDQHVIKLLNMDGRTRVLHHSEGVSRPVFYQFYKVPPGVIMGSSRSFGMGFLNVDIPTLSYTFQSFGSSMDVGKVYTLFLSDPDHNIYASYNEETIHVFEPDTNGRYHLSTILPIAGGVWGLHQFDADSVIYLGNSRGLFKIHRSGFDWEDLNEARHLPTSIQCVTGDTLGNLWMSTNSGILRYHPSSGRSELFTESDGVRSKQFNGHSIYRDSAGQIYFGGTEGVTVFDPYSVSHSTRAAPVNVFGFNVNDAPSDMFRDGVTQSLSLPYDKRTLSFEFQAIDYTAQTETCVRYKMSDYDRDWVASASSRGFARYADMRPGHYTFSLQGMNADGVLNEDIRTIDIQIIPPFYMTWWFRLLVGVAVFGLGYLAIRMYYRRKLERKDMELKEKSLRLEKQAAIERERNRIAAEMHDDLGAGLTTIKFLSERALKHTMDENEAREIRRIADQSNRLVTNMSEIIWAMNSRFDTMESLAGYIRHYTGEYLEEHDIDFIFRLDPGPANPVVTAEKRRNVFLVVKELLHNTVKHSGASAVEMRIVYSSTQCTLTIVEKDVAGFDPAVFMEKGNGLYNMQKRMAGIGGEVRFHHEPPEMIVTLVLPLENP